MWSAARIFVGSLFALIGVAFVVPAMVLIYEFNAIDWQTLLFAHSHLFFFFPVFGVLALVAFYVPAVAALLHPEEQRRVIAEGHEIGIHGWIHELNIMSA